jgi:hypothetical protein
MSYGIGAACNMQHTTQAARTLRSHATAGNHP